MSSSDQPSGNGTPTTSSFPLSPRALGSSLKSVLARLTPSQSSTDLSSTGFRKAADGKLFPQTEPVVDGEACLRDCESCTIKYPRKWSVDESDKLYGHINGWARHLIVATGKADWVRDVADEKGSVMEAVQKKAKVKVEGGKLMLSASNIPLPHDLHRVPSAGKDVSTRVLLLPAFKWIDNVSPSNVDDLIREHINTAPTNTTPLNSSESTVTVEANGKTAALSDKLANLSVSDARSSLETSAALPNPTSDATVHSDDANGISAPAQTAIPPTVSSSPIHTHACKHTALILLCSQATRDARCGQSAPLLRREFERHLRPLGLYRDLDDERPGGVGIYFISHVGGHKYAANVLIYRRSGHAGVISDGAQGNQEEARKGDEGGGDGEAAQCIWLARVRPEDCENIVRYTVLQGKVVKPERQLRGGFDRGRQLVSW